MLRPNKKICVSTNENKIDGVDHVDRLIIYLFFHIVRMSLNINAAMPWFIIHLSFMTTQALHGSYVSHCST